jgi:hypothetical protein
MTAGSTPVSARDGSLLLSCLGVRPHGGTDTRPPMLTLSDWVEVLHQAGANGVTPLLYHRLKTIVPAPELPPPVLDHLRDACVRSAAQSLQIGRELAQVLEALRRHGIAVVALKGAHLGQVVYRSFALRTMCDLDVLVRREDLTRATEVLTGLGYAPQYYGVEEVDYARHHHLRPLARPGGIRVEIHWHVVQPTVPFAIDLEGLWERAQRAEIAGVEALVLSAEDLVLHLCLHASFSHKFRVGLRACWDIFEVVRHYRDTIDWDQVVRRAQQWGIGKYAYLTLRLARELLGADVPVAVIAALEPADFPPEVVAWARTCIFTAEVDTSVSPSMAKLWTSGRLRTKLTLLLRVLYPPRAAMARIYRTPPDSARIYLYYLLRWPDLLLRYGRHAWGLWRGDHDTRDDLRAVSERTALADWLGRPVRD